MAEVKSKTFLSDYAKKYLKNADPATQRMFNELVKDLRVDMPLESAVSEALRKTREGKKLLNTLIYKTKKLSEADQLAFCSSLSKGGLPGDCTKALKANPEKAAQVLSDAPITSVAMKNVKKDSQKLIEIFRGERANAPGKMMVGDEMVPYSEKLKGRFYTANKGMAESFADDPSKIKRISIPKKDFNIGTKLARRINVDQKADQLILPRKTINEIQAGSIKYNSDIGAIVNKNGSIAGPEELKTFAAENPIDVKAGTEDAFKPIKKNFLKTVGKTLAKVGAPLPTALLDSYFIGKQIQDDKPAAEIAKDPLNWLGLATMSTLTKVGGVTGSGTANSILRLGMNPGLIRGISRFAGLPGLALSTGFTAYDQYKKYKNEEGLIYNLFNDSSKPIE
jgi:hypothetical protein